MIEKKIHKTNIELLTRSDDNQREVCRRWKLLGPEDRQHYFEIAEYQHEKEIESTKDNPQQPNKPEEDHQSLPTEQ